MEIKLKYGIDKLVFGMKQADVISIYGKADTTTNDEEGNVIFAYNAHKIRLTFYDDEDLKLGYIISANPELTLLGNKIIGKNPDEVVAFLTENGIKPWEAEDIDIDKQYFNEANWIMILCEFGKVAKIELGAIINDNDEFEWKYKK